MNHLRSLSGIDDPADGNRVRAKRRAQAEFLVNLPALTSLNRFAYARNDADFPVKLYEDGTRPERESDHDMPVAYFNLGPPLIISEFRARGAGGTTDEYV